MLSTVWGSLRFLRRLDRLEAKTDAKFTAVFEAIRQLMAPAEAKKRPIGFVHNEAKKRS